MMTIYKEVLLDHYHNPKNYGHLERPDQDLVVQNSSCGDKIRLTIKVEDMMIQDVKFEGHGCAISTASASMLTEKVKGMRIQDVNKLTSDDITKMLGIQLSPNRLKCALLPLQGLLQIQ